jgi:hypothetical protein
MTENIDVWTRLKVIGNVKKEMPWQAVFFGGRAKVERKEIILYAKVDVISSGPRPQITSLVLRDLHGQNGVDVGTFLYAVFTHGDHKSTQIVFIGMDGKELTAFNGMIKSLSITGFETTDYEAEFMVYNIEQKKEK